MITKVKRYLDVRHAAGFELKNTEYLLSSFAHWAAQRGENHIHTESAIAWASQTVSRAQRDARLKTVCRFAGAWRIRISSCGRRLVQLSIAKTCPSPKLRTHLK